VSWSMRTSGFTVVGVFVQCRAKVELAEDAGSDAC
jgi:hypothetical protein